MKKTIAVTFLVFNLLPFYQSYAQSELTEAQQREIERKKNQKMFMIPESLKGLKLSSGIQVKNIDHDTDLDGLPDKLEVIIGTSAVNPDTDGDALLDGWEVLETNGVNLRELGASPLHKDIFVEMDYMVKPSAANGLKPNQNVIFKIIEIFAASPVSNPDGVNGINIHLIEGNEIPFDETLYPLFDEFPALKKQHFDASRASMFHYMIWANAYEFSGSSGYSFGIPSSDFIVTLGQWNDGMGGTDEQKIGTFIHELGHNLGLMHGGSEHINYKPNHLSVMNYFFQMSGVAKDINNQKSFLFTYQPFTLPRLDERTLTEVNGLGSQNAVDYYTLYFGNGNNIVEVKAGGVIDWNTTAGIEQTPIEADINYDFQKSILRETKNEWLSLVFKGGTIGSQSLVMGIINESITRLRLLPHTELDETAFKKINAIRNK